MSKNRLITHSSSICAAVVAAGLAALPAVAQAPEQTLPNAPSARLVATLAQASAKQMANACPKPADLRFGACRACRGGPQLDSRASRANGDPA